MRSPSRATGFGLNLRYLGTARAVPLLTLAWTLPASLVGGYVAVALVARLLGPVLSSKEQEATSRAQLVGQIGVVISSQVNQEFGEVRIRDKTGHDVRVICKLPKGTDGAGGGAQERRRRRRTTPSAAISSSRRWTKRFTRGREVASGRASERASEDGQEAEEGGIDDRAARTRATWSSLAGAWASACWCWCPS